MTLLQFNEKLAQMPEIEKLFNGDSSSKPTSNQDLLNEARKYGLKVPKG